VILSHAWLESLCSCGNPLLPLSPAYMPSACAGQELQGDAVTVQVHELRNRSTLNAMESPEPNKFTRAPAEYRPLYELSSMSWLLSQEVRPAGRRWLAAQTARFAACGMCL
jgi:hypothetical protein